MMPMSRCVVGAVVLALAGAAAASPLDRACDCSELAPLALPDHSVPRNARFWVPGRTTGAVRIDRLDGDWHDSLTGDYATELGASVFRPTALAPGRYAISYADIPSGQFTVVDETDSTPPAQPVLGGVVLETSESGETERFAIEGAFDRETALLAIEVSDGETIQMFATQPDRLELCASAFHTKADKVRVVVRAMDLAGNLSAEVTREVVPTRSAGPSCRGRRHYTCGLGPMMIYLVGGFFLLVLVIGITAVALLRRINRGTTGEPPIILTNLVATALAKHARARDGVWLALVAGALAAAWMYIGAPAILGGAWLVARIGDYITASRALSLLGRGAAIAELYGTNLVVRADGKQSAVLLSRGEISHAKRNAVPTAKIQ